MKWEDLPNAVDSLIKEGSTMFNRIREAIRPLPKASWYGVWFNPKSSKVYFSLSSYNHKDNLIDTYSKALQSVKGVKEVIYEKNDKRPSQEGPWLHVKKASLQDYLSPLAHLGGWKSNPVTNLVGGPSPFTATLASSALLGAGGYGLGSALESFIPKKYMRRGQLRDTTTSIGALLGAVPGLLMANQNIKNDRSFFAPIGSPKIASLQRINSLLDFVIDADDITKELNDRLYKQAFNSYDPTLIKSIDKDKFNRDVWEDINTPTEIKGLTSGLLQGASQVSDDTALISPMDIARIGIGMGSGYMSGMLVGKTLGALAGISDEAQDTLKRTGVWSGIISNVVPMVFRKVQ